MSQNTNSRNSDTYHGTCPRDTSGAYANTHRKLCESKIKAISIYHSIQQKKFFGQKASPGYLENKKGHGYACTTKAISLILPSGSFCKKKLATRR